MKGKIVVGMSSRLAYIPAQLRAEGYIGEIETLANSCTVTLMKPGTPLEEIKDSLEVVLLDIELRIKQEIRNNGKGK